MRVRAFLLAVLVLVVFPAAAAADYPHVVRPGETLTSVAAADGVSIDALAAANHISAGAELIVGQILRIPPQTAASEAGSTTATSGGGTASGAATTSTAEHPHIVAPGETLTSVAAANGVTIAALAAANHMSPRAELIAGKTLIIPTVGATEQAAGTAQPADNEAGEEAAEGESGSSQTENASYTSTHSSASTGTSASTSTSTASAGGPQPTLERVSSAEIADVADANGVPANLAEAVAWQESGWNNDEVSSVGAVGVMQIVPNTWSWIDRYLTPSNPLGTASASENVRAGVLLLRQLLQLTGGDQQLAIAGYYQGLGSVKRFGMYRSTRQYVNDVLALEQRF